jgi:ParB family chromosome partitioning protein
MTTATVEQVVELALDRLAPHPRNVRRSPGDLRELTRSIRDRGVETPLVVLPVDDAGVHHIVAGHRRHAAAAAAGRTTVPCIVRDYADDADVVLAMLAENTQRSDGLNIVDEAQALAAVIDLKGGPVSARKLAVATGHGEGWVRTRLALLTLPDTALDALHAGDLALDTATALTDLADHADLIDELIANHRPLTAWQVESAHRSLLITEAMNAARESLERSGTTVVLEDDWQANHATWVTLDEAHLDPDAHHGEPCHAVLVKARYDATVVEIPVCTEPRRHRGRKPESTVVAAPVERSEADQKVAVERRERRAATEARAGWLRDRLGGRPLPASDTTKLAVLTWVETTSYAATQKATQLLGLQTPDDGYVDYAGLLIEHVTAEPKRLAAVAVALVAATVEERARQSLTGPTVTRYLDAIERWGYQPTEWELAQRLSPANP